MEELICKYTKSHRVSKMCVIQKKNVVGQTSNGYRLYCVFGEGNESALPFMMW